MTAPGNVTGEKLATQYLADVTHAALRYLPKGDRLKFVGRTRALIERRVGPLRDAELGAVAAVLADLGQPEELVRQERARIDAAWASRRAAARDAADAAAAAPWEQRPLTSRWRPATGDRVRLPRPGGIRRRGRRAPPVAGPDAGQAAGPPDAGQAAGPGNASQPQAPGPAAAPGEPPGRPPAETERSQPASASNGHAATPGELEAWRLDPEQADPAVIEPTSLVPPARPPLPPEVISSSAAGAPTIPGLPVVHGPVPAAELPPSAGGPGEGSGALVPLTPAGLMQLARTRRREAVAIALLGVGGLLLPMPFWPLGAIAVAFCRFWEARHKWLGLFGPVLFWLAATIPVAAIAGGHGNAVVVYLHVLRLDARYLVRLGCAVTAAYLTLLVRRGRRVRTPPWRR